MKKRPKQTDTDTITCGECDSATEEDKYRKMGENTPFCVWCSVDGLLKVKRWPCIHGRKRIKN